METVFRKPPFRKPVETAPHRMQKLAKLPLFMDLHGRCVLVAGNGAAAAWKAELLAASGADVMLFADAPGEDMQALLQSGAADGRLLHQACNWHAADFAGPDCSGLALAVIEAEDDAEAAAFRDTAHRHGVLACAIDRPGQSDVQFGSIINRSPIVIGISTDGAAPVLGQAIRRRIEMLLPPALTDWAAMAKQLRGKLKDLLPDAATRRAYWRRWAELAFTAPASEAEARSLALAHAYQANGAHQANGAYPANGFESGGSVTLVGAGPGDAELLTIKAMRALQSADVILFDDLVSQDVLDLARREAKRMLVGKRGRRASCKQDDINDLMLRLARQGKHVVRLKSGDPMIFGRAGEEIERLRAANIPVRVVPGITAALAAAASLGVSLTHRQAAHSVRFVTGHAKDGSMPAGLDWRGMADPDCTLMLYMGGGTAPAIAARLIAEGASPDLPVSAMAAISRPDEARWHGRLQDLLDWQGSPIDTGAPLLIGIGQVFRQAATQEGESAINAMVNAQTHCIALENSRFS